jgi:hypothetical protein
VPTAANTAASKTTPARPFSTPNKPRWNNPNP